jgi:glucokinase
MHEMESRLPALTAGVKLKQPALGSFVADIGALYLVMADSWQENWRANSLWQNLGALPSL